MNARTPQRAGTEYEIVVRGTLSEGMAREFGASRLVSRGQDTVIVVDVIDRSHLHGVLERLGDLNIVLKSVARPSR